MNPIITNPASVIFWVSWPIAGWFGLWFLRRMRPDDVRVIDLIAAPVFGWVYLVWMTLLWLGSITIWPKR